MRLRGTDAGWGALVRAFHWLIAVLILVQAVIGLSMVGLGVTPEKVRVFALHKSIGITILALVLLRIAWRLGKKHPADPASMPRWQRRAARAMHLALYGLILAIPLSGWWFNSASGAPLVWFGWFQLPGLGGYAPVWKPRALLLHQTLFWLLVALLVLHVGAALWHHFRQRDDVLRRMVFGERKQRGDG
ncbi:MAG: cytochrome b [Rhodanobacteraceae bacterium]